MFIDSLNPRVLYAAAMSGGKAYKSTDGGDSWDDIQFGFPRLGAGMAMNPGDPSLLFATSQAGFLTSRDGGKSWKQYKTNVRVFPWLWRDPPVLEMAADGSALYAASAAGVFKSLDGGNTWTAVGKRPAANGPWTMRFASKHPNIIYAQAKEGVYKSTNSGKEWRAINSGLPEGLGLIRTLRALVVDPSDPNTLYVGTGGRGVFKSVNGGESWVPAGAHY